MSGDFNLEGDVAEAEAVAEFTRRDYTVSRPLTDHAEYDLLVEKNGNVHAIQVKSSQSVTDGVAQFWLRCSGDDGYSDAVDYFVLYSSPADTCFALPLDEAPDTSVSISIGDSVAPGISLDVSMERHFSS